MIKNKLILLAFFAIFSLAFVSASSISDRTLGKESAPVTIEMFADFECPYCSMWHTNTFSLIKENYVDTGEVKLIVRHFPLESIHFNAKNSAIAAQCAADQGRFFEYTNLLYNNQDSLDEASLLSYAEDLNLNLEEFQYCIDEPATSNLINQDVRRGKNKNIRGTPSFLINGKEFSGAQPYYAFEKEINEALANTNPYSCTDVNKDRMVDEADISKLTDYAFGGIEIPEGTNADLNEDGVVDILDVTFLTNYLFRNGPAPSCAIIVEPTFVMNACGDTNGDVTLDQADLDAITSYAFEGVEVPSNVNADLNNDGVVDVLDVVTMTNHVKRNGDKPSCAEKPVSETNGDKEEIVEDNPTIVPPTAGNSGESVIVNPSTNDENNYQEPITEPSTQNEDTSLEDIEQRLDNLEEKVDENNKTLEKILKILTIFFKF